MRSTHQRGAIIAVVTLALAAGTAVTANAVAPKASPVSAAARATHQPASAGKPSHAASPSKVAKPSKPAKAAKPNNAAKADKAAKNAKGAKAAKVRTKFVNAGTVTAVNAAAGTITLRVRGGRDKALRGQLLTVTVTATTKIQRNDAAATLASVAVGDHVNVKGTKAGTAYTAVRVAASVAGA